MANWDRNFTGGTYAGNWHCRLDYWVDGQSAGGNYSVVRLRMYIWCDSGYSQTGTWVPRGRGSWMGEYGSNQSRTINSGHGFVLMASWDGNVGHDVNGNKSVTVGTYASAPINDMSWADIGWNLPRIPLAPTIADVSVTPGTVKPTTAQLRAETGSYGHGTSSTWTMYYRLQGAGSWTNAGSQGDGAGYNYWNLTNLKPGKTYEFYVNATNNNGDSTNSSTQTFDTQSVPGMVPVLIGLLR